MNEPPTPTPTDPKIGFYLSSSPPIATTRIRVRRLKSGVKTDCAALSLLPSLSGRVEPKSFDASLFDEGSFLDVKVGESAPVRRDPLLACDIVRIEHPSGSAAWGVLTGGSYSQSINVTDKGFEGSIVRGPDAPQTAAQVCGTARPAEVGISEPAPIGRGLTIDDVQAAGGCSTWHLKGAADGGAFAVRICTGDLRLPFVAGDVVSIAPEQPASSVSSADLPTLRIEGHTRDGQLTRLWIATGSLSRRGNTGEGFDMSAGPDASCQPLEGSSCGDALPARIDVSMTNRSISLHSGERASLVEASGASLDVLVGNAAFVPLTAGSSCPVASGLRVALLERSRPKAPSVAAP